MLYDFFEKSLYSFSTDCFFRVRWKIYCPGCGGTRALLALMKGDIIQSLKYNPIIFLFIVDVLVTISLYIIDRMKGNYTTAILRKTINVIFLVVIVIFFLLRNYLLYGWGIDVLGDFS